MIILWIVQNLGAFLLGSSAFCIVALLIHSRIRKNALRREERQREEEARRAQAEKLRRQAVKEQEAQEAAARAKAEKEAARREREAQQAREQAEKEAARQARQAAADARRAAALENARQLAEYRERALSAAKELHALDHPEAATPAPAPAPESSAPVSLDDFAAAVAPAPAPAAAPDNAPKPFAGHAVSFTGKLKSMSRPKAAEMVRKAGGKAFVKDMPVGTTLLVVGDTHGENTRKLDKADEWIGQLRKITEAQFLDMFNAA